MSNRVSGGTRVRINGDTNILASEGPTSNGTHQGVMTTPTGVTAISIRGTTDFEGDVDDIHLVKDIANALALGQMDFGLVPITQINTEGSPVGPFTLTIF